MDVDVLSFSDALALAENAGGKAHVLLGNGFSIACRPDQFTYDALFDGATFEGSSCNMLDVFGRLGTTDFEKVIETLEMAADLAEIYATIDPDLANRLRDDADIVRESLAQVLAARHPDLPFDISDDEYDSARRFLSNFERIYTTNYDMLLYWTVMKDGMPTVVRNDGFGNPEDDGAKYVVWEPYATFSNQRLFYLHGGLHLYDNGSELAKITWSRTATPLIDQIRHALDSGRYPLIVTEGSSKEKTEKILHHAYLTHGIRSFSSIQGTLFLFGLSLAPNDEHLLRRIAEGKVDTVFVSIYGDPSNDSNQAVIQRANALADERSDFKKAKRLTVRFFDAQSANVWS